MNPLDQVNAYLKALESRLRWTAVSKGAAAISLAALLATILLVLSINAYAFSETSLTVARILLFLCLAVAITFGLAVPLLRLNRWRTARLAERKVPEFNERLLTFAERKSENDPWIELLAADTIDVARKAQPEEIVHGKWIFGSLSAATVSAIILAWLVLYGPGFLGHGASLLWAGTPRPGMRTAFYEVVVSPGDHKVRTRADQMIQAHLVGFSANRVNLFARFASASKWEQVQMEPDGTGFQFLFAGLPESVDYYVEAGGVKSKSFKLTAVDLPHVKKLRVTYEYPKWSGLKNVVEDPGGDLRAIEGSTATVDVETDKPLKDGVLILEDGQRINLQAAEGNWLRARVPIQKDGMYYIAAIDSGEDVRLTEDYFIEAQREEGPTVRIARPGRDPRVNPIEEVTVAVEAQDDFGIQDLKLHYSVNGGPEKVVPLLKAKGEKEVQGETLIALEEFKLVPGDLVSMYASAKDARAETRSDIMFVEAQPFEREYEQSQLAGGGGGGGMQEQDNVSLRQKEIIAATFNQVRDKSGDKKAASENAKFLSEMQSKLRDQSASLAKRMRSRELTGTSQEFRTFASDMEQAAKFMGEAADKLKGQQWQDAISPEQQALQHLLRAEATRRRIQVAFGARGGGGGGGGAGRDLESLFDLELDLEKNQYETGQQSASADQRGRQVDEALQRLQELAKRQQQLAQQQRDGRQAPQVRWQQEMLRREAEELRRQMEELARNNQSQGQQSSQQQQGSSSSASSQGSQSGQSGMDSRLRRAVDRLARATEDMRRAASSQANEPQSGAADARRAADRLQEAQNALGQLRQQESGQELDSIANRAEQLAQQQNEFVNKLRSAFPSGQSGENPRRMPGQTQGPANELAREKEQMMSELSQLERDMQAAVRNLAGSQRNASSKLREALGEMQQNELKNRMRFHAEWIRRGLGSYIAPREAPITEGLDRLAEQTKEAQAALGPGGQGDEKEQGIERALNQVERLREQLARATQTARGSQQGQRGQQGQQGQQQGRGQQPGQQAGQGNQQGQQAQGGQGQQPGQGNQQGPGQNGQMRGQGAGGDGQRGGQYGSWQGMYRSGDSVPNQGPITNAGIEDALRIGTRELSQLRQEFRGTDGDVERELQEALKELQKYDPAKIANDPKLAERIQSAVLPAIEQLELQLRRKLEGNQAGQVRTAGSERVPQGYADAVAEYFRRLSQGK